MLNLPIYGDKKLITAFEYGIVMATMAHDKRVDLSRDILVRMEDIILAEFKQKDWKKLNTDMAINILAAFEPKDK